MNFHRRAEEVRETLANWLIDSGVSPGDRLPPERELCGQLGMSRGELRKALSALEVEGVVERHVGRGTFLKSDTGTGAGTSDQSFIRHLAEITSPHAAMMARLSLEPELAGHAAIHAAPRHLAELRRLGEEIRAAKSWTEYELYDSQFHELIAKASGNPLLAELYRIVNEVRVSVVWSRLDLPVDGPPSDYHSFSEHDEIIEALERRDRARAHTAMRDHLKSVRATLLRDE
ncbi:MAG: FadR/GntR family transcriptional regulator [Paracoccaceae bacterium]|nr:FadR/GntR family transcriptional regulator [Paracoccaceae bacterium]